MEYYERMRQIRKFYGETQKEIAEILHISPQQYSFYESGKSQISAESLRAFCLHYGVSSDYILGMPEGMKYPNL